MPSVLWPAALLQAKWALQSGTIRGYLPEQSTPWYLASVVRLALQQLYKAQTNGLFPVQYSLDRRLKKVMAAVLVTAAVLVMAAVLYYYCLVYNCGSVQHHSLQR